MFVVRHPLQPGTLLATANTVNFTNFFVSEGTYLSGDNGDTWTGSDTLYGEPIVFHGGDPGIAIDKDGTFILSRLGRFPIPGLYAHYSTDNGATWSGQVAITQNEIERAAVASDVFPGSPFYGRTYAVYVRFESPFAVWISWTDDGGATWSTARRINSPSQRSSGADIAIRSDGTLHVSWAGVTASSPFTEVLGGAARSSDGGQSWTVSETAFSMNGIQGVLSTKSNIRVNGLPRIDIDNSGGPRDGWLYVVTTEINQAPAGSDPDVVLRRSTDGGTTWSAGIRVNRDALSNGAIQYFPAPHVDEGGGLNVLFYDDRNTSSDSTGVMLARSTDGGDTWVEVEISDHNFRPVPIGGLGQGYQGDNIDLASSQGRLIPLWMDNSSGEYQIWTAPVEIRAVAIGGGDPTRPEGFFLGRNYPNPFNPETTVEFGVGNAEWVTLTVYDMLGRAVRTLVDGPMAAGRHVSRWDGRDDAGRSAVSGVYLYRLVAGSFVETRKMLLAR